MHSLVKKKKNSNIPNGFPKGRKLKRNSRMLQNDENTLSWVNDTKKLPREFRSSTKSPVKYNIIEGLPCEFKTRRQPLREL